MPVKTRAANGRFESCDKSLIMETPVSEVFQKEWFLKIVKFVILLFVISPWLVIFVKNNIYSNISKKVNDFYDDNFSCANACANLYKNITLIRDDLRVTKANEF